MGKWNRRYASRPRRRYYQDYQWSPPREPCPDPETEDWQDNVPMWEKKFCYLVGRMPWKKVLSTKNFMHCHNNVLNWDDSAGEEAFLKAKKGFWEEINGLPRESLPPNPDMYIDEIDWNPYIDPELAMELDREYFNPDDKYYLPSACSSKRNNNSPDNVSNPWECSLQNTAVQDKATGWNKWNHQPDDGDNDGCCSVQNNTVNDKSTGWNQWDNSGSDDRDNHPGCVRVQNNSVAEKTLGWNQWDSSVKDRSKLPKDDDPWESHCTLDNAAGKNSTWGGDWHKSWGSKQQNQSDMTRNWNTESNSWRNEGKRWNQSDMSRNWNTDGNSWRNEGKRWQDHRGTSRGWNQRKSAYPNDDYKPRDYGSHHRSRVPNGRGDGWGQKQWDSSNWESKDSINISRGRGRFSAGGRKREGPDHYATNHKGPRLHWGNSQSSHYWNEANNQKASFRGQWS